jgi:pyridoxal phosphate enzyme (YggS family)
VTLSPIAERWWKVRDTVVAACARCGRDPAEITIVAVSKFHPAAAVEDAAAAGVTDVAENYAQELVEKAAQVTAPVRWHFIGTLQRNKAKMIVGKVALIHTVDTIRVAEEIDRRALAAGVVQPVLVEVNVAGEQTKSGVSPPNAPMLVAALGGLAHVRCDGLMTMPPPGDLVAAARSFEALRALRDELATRDRPLPILSMGMSADYEAAIAAGATHLRIGTAIFGARP